MAGVQRIANNQKREKQWHHENYTPKNHTPGSSLPNHLFGLAHDSDRFHGADSDRQLANRAESSPTCH